MWRVSMPGKALIPAKEIILMNILEGLVVKIGNTNINTWYIKLYK